MSERETEPNRVTPMRMLEADAVEQWSSALHANDDVSVGQLVEQGHVLRASAGTRWIGKAVGAERSSEQQVDGSSSKTRVSKPLADGGGPGRVGPAVDQMADREMARGRRMISRGRG